LIDFESRNLGDLLNNVNFINQSEILEKLHSIDFGPVVVCNDDFPSGTFDILVSRVFFFQNI